MKKWMLIFAVCVAVFMTGVQSVSSKNVALMGAAAVGLGGSGYGLFSAWRKMQTLKAILAEKQLRSEGNAAGVIPGRLSAAGKELSAARARLLLSAIGTLLSAVAFKKGFDDGGTTAPATLSVAVTASADAPGVGSETFDRGQSKVSAAMVQATMTNSGLGSREEARRKEEEQSFDAPAGALLTQGIKGLDPAVVARALQKGAHPDGEPGNLAASVPLFLAIGEYTKLKSSGLPTVQCEEIIDTLLRAGASVFPTNGRPAYPLLGAVSRDCADIVKKMLEIAKPEVGRLNEKHSSVIGASHSLEMFKVLMDYGCDIHIPGDRGKTILHWWVEYAGRRRPSSDNIQILIDLGFNVGVRDSSGRTALHMVNDVVTAKKLLERDVSLVHARDNTGATPLMTLLERDYFWLCESSPEEMGKVVDLLLKCGADINAQNVDGETALHRTGRAEIAKLLTDSCGARTDIKNKQGFAPLMWRALAPTTTHPSFFFLLESDKVDPRTKTPEFVVQDKAFENWLKTAYWGASHAAQIIKLFVPKEVRGNPEVLDSLKALADRAGNDVISRGLAILMSYGSGA